MILRALLIASLVSIACIVQSHAQSICPPGSTCGGFGAMMNGTSTVPSPVQPTDIVPVIRSGHTYNSPAIVPLSASPQVANTTALRAAATTTFPNGVWRITDGVAGAPPLWFTPKSGACATDDGAFCVDSSDGNQWDGVFPASGADVREWSPDPTGSTNSEPAFAAAISSMSGVAKVVIPPGKFLFTSGLVDTTHTVFLQGSGGIGLSAASGCAAALTTIFTNSDINLLTLTGPTVTLRDFCVQMAQTYNTRTSGAAITVGGTNSAGNGGDLIDGVAWINSYDGLLIGGNTSGGLGQQTNGVTVINSQCLLATKRCIAVGSTSTNRSTVGIWIYNDKINCAEISATSIGLAIYDAAINFNFGDNGPYECNVGTYIYPAPGQFPITYASGVVGDSSLTADMLIDSNGGSAIETNLSHIWLSAAGSGDTALLIRNTSGTANLVKKVVINGFTFVSSSVANKPLVDLENDVATISLSGGLLDPNGGSGEDAILDNTSGSDIVFNGINTNFNGSFSNFIQLGSSNANTIITSNDMRNTSATPIAGTFLSGSFQTVADNQGIDTVEPTIASGSTIAIPFNPKFYISGSTSMQFTTGQYKGIGTKTAFPVNSATAIPPFLSGGNFCNALTPGIGRSVIMNYDWTNGCWFLTGG
jgi:hypothetical protein